MQELAYKLWFYELPIKKADKIEILKSGLMPAQIWNFKALDYIIMGIGIINAGDIDKNKNIALYEEISEYLIKEKIKFILYNESEYPEILKNIYNPPVGLFLKGNFPDINNSAAIVGARKASDYGKTAAYKFAYELSSRGIVIISGMARGIDSCAHKGAIDGGCPTVAVMGSGFKNIYPKENFKLFTDIINNGCVITEYLPDVLPMAFNFPERNRIISGLSSIVIVIEAGERSGSLITVDFALEQGKEVFAVPGNIFSHASVGTNRLIKEGARPVTCFEDILEEFDIRSETRTYKNIDDTEKTILNLLKAGGMNVDNIMQSISCTSDNVLATLSKLECQGFIKRMYGSYYILC